MSVSFNGVIDGHFGTVTVYPKEEREFWGFYQDVYHLRGADGFDAIYPVSGYAVIRTETCPFYCVNHGTI